MLLRAFYRLLAPLFFWVSYGIFRSRHFKASTRLGRWALNGFRLAADLGHRRALSVYGHLLYLRGDSVQSRIQGGVYLERAAERGEMKAQYQVGRIYEVGCEHSFRADPAKALAYYRQAAEQGHILAIGRLAEAYENGELGVEADHQQADRWRVRLPG